MFISLMILAEAWALSGSQALATAAPVAAPVAAPLATVRALKDLPNTTIEYYDVVGQDIKSIQASVASARGGTADKPLSPASASWTLGSKISRRTLGEKCAIAATDLNFAAKVVLPRLANQEQVPAPVLANWRSFVAGLESGTAANLWFVHDRIGTIRTAILGSSCEGANAAAAAAVDRLRKDEAEFVLRAAAAQAAAQAKPGEPAKPVEQPEKPSATRL